MTVQDLAQAQAMQAQRAAGGNFAAVRRGVVTAASPLTVAINGTSVASVPYLPSYSPVVGDVVLVLVDGASMLVIDRIRIGGTSAGGDWVADSTRNPIVKTSGGNETRGNATVIARYRVINGECQWQGHYVLGSTTAWPVGTFNLVLPVNPEASYFATAGASMPGSLVRAYNGSFFFGHVEYLGGANLGLVNCFGRSISTTADPVWTVNTVPIAWAAGNILSWDLRYPIV